MTKNANNKGREITIVDRMPHKDFFVDLAQFPNSIVFTRQRRLHEKFWHSVLNDQKIGHHAPVNYLEIGCQEGSATLWFAQHYLGHTDCRYTLIDKFAGTSLDNLVHNLKLTGIYEKSDVKVGISGEALREIPLYSMDFIYLDGLHATFAVIEDAILCWRLLKNGGVIIFDDYLWENRPELMNRPRPAIDFFMRAYEGKYEVIKIDWQVALRKTYADSEEDNYLTANN